LPGTSVPSEKNWVKRNEARSEVVGSLKNLKYDFLCKPIIRINTLIEDILNVSLEMTAHGRRMSKWVLQKFSSWPAYFII
jgi:hypothetical protein